MRHSIFAATLIVVPVIPGNAFAEPALSIEQATAIIAPFYDALNQPAKKDVAALLGKATSDNWVTCGSDQVCLPREKVIPAFKSRGETIPDLKWEIKDVIVSDNRVIVRGEATGTPAKQFMGIEPTGKSFRIMSIDIQTINSGKISHSYHIEDWAGAVRQLANQ